MAENLATNPFIGDEINDDEKDENHFRIYFANANGFTLSENGGDYAEFLLEMQKLQADTWGVAETNIDSTKSAVKNIIHDTTRKHFEFSKTTIGSSNIPARKRYYKPGGTLMGSQGSITARIIDQGSDSLGRWSFQLMNCKNNKKLLVVAAYQVCKQAITYTDNDGNTTVRSYTASAQQSSMLLVQGRRESPREAFIMDLGEFIQRYQDQQCEILLLGDFNESMSDSGEGISALGSQCNLVDVMQQQIGHSDFGTHVTGSERIDFILASERVADAVRYACYEPFKFRGSGDHRGMILDLDTLALFGNRTQALAPIPCREFTAKDPIAVRQYIAAKHRYLQEHNFGTRLERAITHWTPQVQEQLDANFQQAGTFGAKQCTRKPRNIAFSSELATLRRRKNILLKTISSIRLKRSFEEAIARYKNQDEEFEIPTTLAACQALCRQIQQQIRQSTKDAVFHRQNEQLIQLRDAEAKGNKKKAKLIKNLMAAERTKNMYKKIRQCRGAEKAGITRLDVPADPDDVNYKSCVDWISIDTPEEIESRLLQRNQTHFGQADGLFPTRPPFCEWIDWGASTHVADLILEGQWNTEELDSVSQDVLRHMQARTNLDEIKDTITIEEWTEKIRTWPEKTSTSPSGFHLSHSKALVNPISIEDDDDATAQLEQQRHQLIEWQVTMLNLAISHCYSLSRWKHIVNVMILKEPNNHRIHRLRVIHLYEQDYNLILAVKWRQMIRNGSNNQLLHPQQFGGVPGKDAILPTMLEEFQYEISLSSKRPLVHLDYDATACYDRIVMSFGSLASRSYGQHRSVVFINAATLEDAKYYLKTQLGVSEKFYKHCKIFPIYGSGQGAGNSPGIWCVISSVLFHAYDEKAHGATFCSPQGEIEAQVFMIGFVDDTSGSTNDFNLPKRQSPEHYIVKATKDAQRWNDVLRVSGGALEDTKCSYHFLYFDFTIDGLPYLCNGQIGPRISIQFNNNNSPHPLKQLSAYQSHKTLGVMKSPASTDRSLFLALAKKNSQHTSVMARSPFNRTDAWAYYHSVYLPSITYPMQSSSLSDKHCKALQRQFKKALLTK